MLAGAARAGENILIDAGTGDAVHVDFSCLFDKGLTLEKPEMVPFRLTQNMIDAFGVSGHEGAFRRACEISMQARLPTSMQTCRITRQRACATGLAASQLHASVPSEGWLSRTLAPWFVFLPCRGSTR
jgi:Phosphatidylinositol 3- and 4-kinase